VRLGSVPDMNLRNFRLVAIAEATSFLLLLVASYLKRAEDQELGVQILGPIHGGLFIAFVVIALNIRHELAWTTRTTLLVLAGAVVPFGGYAVDRWLARNYPGDEPATS
jgi:integral membrane protein